MIKVAVFASGSGTNAENLINHFSKNVEINIDCIFTNSSKAGVIERAKRLKVPIVVFNKFEFESGIVLESLKEKGIEFIVLAGFLWLIPESIISFFRDRIINIHPALLPLHGGKGFYGNNVHRSVINSGAIISGITIHYVNEQFDEGEIIFQAACHVSKTETSETLTQKIHSLEYSYFPVVVEKVIRNLSSKNHKT
jgi:phosphoribosylglycinamide formyltransferase-1